MTDLEGILGCFALPCLHLQYIAMDAIDWTPNFQWTQVIPVCFGLPCGWFFSQQVGFQQSLKFNRARQAGEQVRLVFLIRTCLTGVKSLPVRALLEENGWGMGLKLCRGRFYLQYIAVQLYKMSEQIWCSIKKLWKKTCFRCKTLEQYIKTF